MLPGINMEGADSVMGNDTIQLAHGAGGSRSAELMRDVVLPFLDNPILHTMHDGAVLPSGGRIAFTTDSYVVQPLFFPGGSIGRLAVCGTVNDLAMSGAVAQYLSLSLILEEGLPVAELKQVLKDIKDAADEAGIMIVTGDTKVVNRGAADGIYINTAGIGNIIEGADISPANIRPGMDIIVSGFLGDHAAALLAARHGLQLPAEVKCDAAPLVGLVRDMVAASSSIACLRDPTRGGAAATLNELAGQAGVGILIEEELIPVRTEVIGVCDLLGLDPLTLANEGKLIAVVKHEDSGQILDAMRNHPLGQNACRIGRTTEDLPGEVALRTSIGGIRVVEMPIGELVPRIC